MTKLVLSLLMVCNISARTLKLTTEQKVKALVAQLTGKKYVPYSFSSKKQMLEFVAELSRFYALDYKLVSGIPAKHPTLGPIYKGDIIVSPTEEGIVIKSLGETMIAAQVEGDPSPTAHSVSSITAIRDGGQRMAAFRPAAGLNLVADIKLPQVAFERAGTAVSTRIVVIEKSANSPQQTSRDFSDVADINTLFDRLENMALPDRANESEPEAAAAPAKKEKAPPAKVGDSVTVNGNQYAIEIYTTNDGKDKRGIWMEEKEAKAINPRAFKSAPLFNVQRTMSLHP